MPFREHPCTTTGYGNVRLLSEQGWAQLVRQRTTPGPAGHPARLQCPPMARGKDPAQQHGHRGLGRMHLAHVPGNNEDPLNPALARAVPRPRRALQAVEVGTRRFSVLPKYHLEAHHPKVGLRDRDRPLLRNGFGAKTEPIHQVDD